MPGAKESGELPKEGHKLFWDDGCIHSLITTVTPVCKTVQTHQDELLNRHILPYVKYVSIMLNFLKI